MYCRYRGERGLITFQAKAFRQGLNAFSLTKNVRLKRDTLVVHKPSFTFWFVVQHCLCSDKRYITGIKLLHEAEFWKFKLKENSINLKENSIKLKENWKRKKTNKLKGNIFINSEKNNTLHLKIAFKGLSVHNCGKSNMSKARREVLM